MNCHGEIQHHFTQQLFRTFTSQHAKKSKQYQEILKEHYDKAKVRERWNELKKQFNSILARQLPSKELIEATQLLETTASQLMIGTAKKLGKRDIPQQSHTPANSQEQEKS